MTNNMTAAAVVLASESTLLVAHDVFTMRGKPTSVSHPTLEAIVTAMRANDRTELVHYAGASYRDEVAWRVSAAWMACPQLTESELKAIALNQAYGWDLTAEDVRAANPGML